MKNQNEQLFENAIVHYLNAELAVDDVIDKMLITQLITAQVKAIVEYQRLKRLMQSR